MVQIYVSKTIEIKAVQYTGDENSKLLVMSMMNGHKSPRRFEILLEAGFHSGCWLLNHGGNKRQLMTDDDFQKKYELKS